MIDWTPIPGVIAGLTGVPQYRVENSGLVRWRGILHTTTDVAYNSYFEIPPAATPEPGTVPIYIDFEAGGRSFIANATHMYVGIAGGLVIGSPIDLANVVWQGTPLAPNPHSLTGVQAGLADALRTIAGLRVYDFPSDRIEPPAAVLSLPETPYDVTLSGRSDEWSFPLWVLVAKADDKAAYGEMVGYLDSGGTKSIRAAIEADRTLNGACDTAAVINARPLYATIAGTEFLAVEFTLEVYT